MKKKILFISLALMLQLQGYSQSVVKDTLGLDKSFSASPASLVQGKVSGVLVSNPDWNVNEDYNVIVRSVNSIRTDSQPLWVVDGMPLGSGSLSFINPYDIESIQVLKDAAATAIYGPQGANGVIIVNTRRMGGKDGVKVEWNSNLSPSMPFQSTAATRNAFSHNHSLEVLHTKGQNVLRISGQFRNVNGVIVNNTGNTGKFTVAYETKANPIVWFGTNTFFAVGAESSPTETAVPYGSGSIFIAERSKDSETFGTVEGWKSDFDNDSKVYRVVNSTYLQVNFLKELYLKVNLGMDYYDRSNYLWWGNGTPLGLAYNGYANIISGSRLRFNALPELKWNRWFGDHHIELSAGAEINADLDKYNNMVGWDFFSHELRAKGLNINASKTDIDTWSNQMYNIGAIAALKYAYKDIVGIAASYRADWTPRYDDSKPVNYYSAEAFVKVCSGVKIVGGYGVSGTQNYVPYSKFDKVLAGEYPYVNPQVSYYYEGLMRTMTREWNAGAAFDLLSGRLKGGLKYFRGHTDDSFNAYCFGAKKENSYMWDWADRQAFFDRNCAFTRSGVEFDIDALAIKTRNVSWQIGGNFTWSENVVTEVHPQDEFAISPGNDILTNANVVGQPVGSITGYRTDASGAIVDQTGDGTITQADMVILGNSLPRFYGGVFTTLKLWQFSVDMTLNYALGFDWADLTSLCVDKAGSPKLLDTYVTKGDYLRLGHLGAAYDWNFGQDAFLKGLRASLCYSGYPIAGTVTAGVKLIF